MKNIFVVSGMVLIILSSCSKFKMGQNEKLIELSIKVDSLSVLTDSLAAQNKFQDDEISWLENEIVELKKMKSANPVALSTAPKQVTPASHPTEVSAKPAEKAAKPAEKAVADLQCIAITNSGKRCSRPALTGSKYCLQHKQIYEPDK